MGPLSTERVPSYSASWPLPTPHTPCYPPIPWGVPVCPKSVQLPTLLPTPARARVATFVILAPGIVTLSKDPWTNGTLQMEGDARGRPRGAPRHPASERVVCPQSVQEILDRLWTNWLEKWTEAQGPPPMTPPWPTPPFVTSRLSKDPWTK